MDVTDRIGAGLPEAVEEIEGLESPGVERLWELARSYSRLRHRTSQRSASRRHRRLGELKAHCLRLAVNLRPDLFLIFQEPKNARSWLIYHLVERRLLHVPATVDLGDHPDVRRARA